MGRRGNFMGVKLGSSLFVIVLVIIIFVCREIPPWTLDFFLVRSRFARPSFTALLLFSSESDRD